MLSEFILLLTIIAFIFWIHVKKEIILKKKVWSREGDNRGKGRVIKEHV